MQRNFKPQSPLLTVNIDPNTKWTQEGATVAGGHGKGSGKNQLCFPFGLCFDGDQTMFIADCVNDRIVEWKIGATSGQVVAGGNGEGNRADQLNGPSDVVIDKQTESLIICDRDNRRVVKWSRRETTSGQTIISNIKCKGLTMDNDGCLYASNWGKNDIRRWRMGETQGTIVAGGNEEGDRLDQLSFPGHVFVDRDRSVYVSDWNNHRVMKWVEDANEGVVVAGGHGEGDALTQLAFPYGVVVDQSSTVYVVDCGNRRVMSWQKGAAQGSIVVGGNGPGNEAHQLHGPKGLVFDQNGNLYVSDSFNHRVQKFSIDPHS